MSHPWGRSGGGRWGLGGVAVHGAPLAGLWAQGDRVPGGDAGRDLLAVHGAPLAAGVLGGLWDVPATLVPARTRSPSHPPPAATLARSPMTPARAQGDVELVRTLHPDGAVSEAFVRVLMVNLNPKP
jgi:hypothetical protein